VTATPTKPEKRVLTVAASDPDTLGAWLCARLGVGLTDAAALVARGAVHVDGKRVKSATLPIRAGQKIIAYVAPPPPAVEIAIAYADAWLLVVEKPTGVVAQATRADEAGALDALVGRAHPDARMMHRLDRDASGLVLFARTPEARATLQRALEAGRIDRTYRARVAGRLEGAGRIALRIARDGGDPRRRVALPESAPGGEAAATRWRALEPGDDTTLVECALETGRTHQIRVHLAALGHPIVGDRLYGGRAAPRLLLHATRLVLPHPDGSGRPVAVDSTAIPDELVSR
jgi:23S rRNA pseudouridine1911/1915/1917 synthase